MTPGRLFDVRVPMADGISLSTDVVLPATSGAWPAILIRTPYSKVSDRILGWADFFADYGYAVVAQDVRGRGDSDGAWEPWVNEFDDGHDAVEWIAAQPWCTGKVGMLGGSYEGWVQWATASRHPAHLAAMVTSGSPGRWFRDWPYRFGAFFASDYLEWLNRTARRVVQPVPFPSWAWYVSHPSLRTLDTATGRPLAAWQAALDHCTYDSYWHSLDIAGYEQMDIPVLHVTGWFDACAPGEYHHFRQMRDRSPAADRQCLLVGPWDHHAAVVTGRAVEGDLAISARGTMDLRLVWERWFARWLKGEPADADDPKVRYYILGANEWRESGSWPPAGSKEHVLYLHADGTASTQPSAAEAAREFEYNDIALELAPGEALEVAISSSLAPHYHPNPNTGLGYAGDAPPVVVRQTVFHGGGRPSRLVLRVVPAEGEVASTLTSQRISSR